MVIEKNCVAKKFWNESSIQVESGINMKLE